MVMVKSVICGLVPGRYFVGDVVTAVYGPVGPIDRGDVGVHETDDGYIYAFDHGCTDGNGGGADVVYDLDGRGYTMMSGYLGILPWEMCKYDGSPGVTANNTGGCIIDVHGPIIFHACGGLFNMYMGSRKITIDTRMTVLTCSRLAKASDSDDAEYELEYD